LSADQRSGQPQDEVSTTSLQTAADRVGTALADEPSGLDPSQSGDHPSAFANGAGEQTPASLSADDAAAGIAEPRDTTPEPDVTPESAVAEDQPRSSAAEAVSTEPQGLGESTSVEPEATTAPEATTEREAGATPEASAAAEADTAPEASAQSEASAEPEAPVASESAAAAESSTESVATAEAPPVAPPPVRPRPTGPEPTTMEELLNEQEGDIRSFKHGDVVEGTIVRIDKDEILVDIGAKSEGVVSNRELFGRHAENQPQLGMGDTVLVYVLQPESNEGHAVLSLRRAGLERKWRAMQEQFDAGVIIEAPVIDHNKGGLIVDCGIRGFVPISQIVDFPRRPQNEQPRDAAQEIAEKLQPYVGRKLRLKILEVNRKANRLILSEKVALYEERREKRDELFSSLQVGQKVTGTIRSIAPFGIFVDLGGIDGLVHKSELSWNKVNNPEAGYRVGEDVEAEVIDINHERGRISLSIRRLQPDPWESTVADFNVGDVIDGTVTKIVNFGAFVRVRDGLEGLIHISELSHQRVAHPGDVVHEGQRLQLKIISLDSERHRLGLSLKQAEEAPPARETTRERRPRQERAYDPTQAVQEPEGGIDNTLAAAFAQVRQQVEASEAARDDETGETAQPEATAEASSEPVETSEPAAEPVSDQVVAETLREAPDLETAAVAETADAPALEVAPAPSAETAEATEIADREGQAASEEAGEKARREPAKRPGKTRAAAPPTDEAAAESAGGEEARAKKPADEKGADETATEEITPEAGGEPAATGDAEAAPETADAATEPAPEAPTADEAARSEPTADQTTTAEVEGASPAFEVPESQPQSSDEAGLEAGKQERASPDA
jgi:small subunit ribosomal protein S1